jgi:hypothetical protein
LEFCGVALSVAASTILGAGMAAQNRESIWGDWESTRRKLLQYLGVFCFLAVIDWIYLSAFLDLGVVDQARRDAFPGLCGKVWLMSGAPFGVLSYIDKTWNSNEVFNISLGAWIVVVVALSSRFDLCPGGLLFFFAPLALSATLFHGIGLLCRWAGTPLASY